MRHLKVLVSLCSDLVACTVLIDFSPVAFLMRACFPLMMAMGSIAEDTLHEKRMKTFQMVEIMTEIHSTKKSKPLLYKTQRQTVEKINLYVPFFFWKFRSTTMWKQNIKGKDKSSQPQKQHHSPRFTLVHSTSQYEVSGMTQKAKTHQLQTTRRENVNHVLFLTIWRSCVFNTHHILTRVAKNEKQNKYPGTESALWPGTFHCWRRSSLAKLKSSSATPSNNNYHQSYLSIDQSIKATIMWWIQMLPRWSTQSRRGHRNKDWDCRMSCRLLIGREPVWNRNE